MPDSKNRIEPIQTIEQNGQLNGFMFGNEMPVA